MNVICYLNMSILNNDIFSYTSTSLNLYFQLVPMFSVMADEFMDNVDKAFASGDGSVEMSILYEALTSESICRTAMGVDFAVQKDIVHSKLLKHLRAVFGFGVPFILIVFCMFHGLDTSLDIHLNIGALKIEAM